VAALVCSPALPLTSKVTISGWSTNHPATALFILADVIVTREAEGNPSTRGGRPVILKRWLPRDEDLEPVAYEYSVPL
jgi:hypothetical protein